MAQFLDTTDIYEPRYAVRIGIDGHSYAVFRDEFARYEYELLYPDQFHGCPSACFGQFDNAWDLGATP